MIPPIDLQKFKNWGIEQLYNLIFPFIARDFMGRRSCQLVHIEGNLVAPPSGGPVMYMNPLGRGGNDTGILPLKAIYKARALAGEVQVDIAEETGTFVG